MAGIFAKNVITGFQRFQSPKCDICEIANGSCNKVKHEIYPKNRWHPDSNWGMEALQASALPLGYATINESLIHKSNRQRQVFLACTRV